MVTVTKQQILDFVNAQPDDRPVDMGEASNNDGCGCVMVQYAREHLKSLFSEDNLFDGCGCSVWEGTKMTSNGNWVVARIEDQESISELINTELSFSGTYGDIKANIAKLNWK